MAINHRKTELAPSAAAFPIMRNSICHFDYDIVML